jgi:adenine-specific DNA-methyltransferase
MFRQNGGGMEIAFKGKEAVYNYHLTVPYRPIIADLNKSVGDGGTEDNLIIHGDNLHALKALMPRYAGKIDCVVIDPPYNTGNESWRYNDAVNSPPAKEWLGQVVGDEDLLRHDKWCCMMLPRLRLLYELLSDEGSIWITLDDNEAAHAVMMLDEVFGRDNQVAILTWQKRTTRENRTAFSSSHDYILVYSKCSPDDWKLRRNLLPPGEGGYSNPDNDSRGEWRSIPFSAQGFRKAQVYEIVTPSGAVLLPPRGRCWGATEPEFIRLRDAEERVYFPKDGDGRPRIKRFPWEDEGLVPMTVWLSSDVGTTEEAKKEVLAIFDDDESGLPFETPKPRRLLERIIHIASKPDSVILDSFAGSGTTGHAVLAQNLRDGGARKFILIECEDYAHTLTSERIRRAINGYSFQGSQRETLLERNITWTDIKRASKVLQQVEELQSAHKSEFDDVSIEVKDGKLRVIGERSTTDETPGLGGSFTFCTLGAPLDLDQMLNGEGLPSWSEVAAWLFHTATGATVPPGSLSRGDGVNEWFIAESATHNVWLIYRPSAEFLRSPDAALSLQVAKQMADRQTDKPHLVFAPFRFVSTAQLRPLGVEYALLPFSLNRLERE